MNSLSLSANDVIVPCQGLISPVSVYDCTVIVRHTHQIWRWQAALNGCAHKIHNFIGNRCDEQCAICARLWIAITCQFQWMRNTFGSFNRLLFVRFEWDFQSEIWKIPVDRRYFNVFLSLSECLRRLWTSLNQLAVRNSLEFTIWNGYHRFGHILWHNKVMLIVTCMRAP